MVPLLAINPARSSCLLSIWKSFRQPINSLLLNGKLSAPLGTPPRNSGPVRSRDLRKQIEAPSKQNEGLRLSPKGEMERLQHEKGNTLNRPKKKSIQK